MLLRAGIMDVSAKEKLKQMLSSGDTCRWWGRWWWRCRRGLGWGARTAALLGALPLLLAAGWLWVAPPVRVRAAAYFPRVSPRALAHRLADFNNHPLLYPYLGEWALQEESGNYSAWRYVVWYACGPRCSGRAAVLAQDVHAGGAAGVGAAGRHPPPASFRLRVAHRCCTHAPLLAWLKSCEEWETETEVEGDGAGGAVLRERARASCGGLGALLPPACAARLRAARGDHLRRLRALLATSATTTAADTHN